MQFSLSLLAQEQPLVISQKAKLGKLHAQEVIASHVDLVTATVGANAIQALDNATVNQDGKATTVNYRQTLVLAIYATVMETAILTKPHALA